MKNIVAILLVKSLAIRMFGENLLVGIKFAGCFCIAIHVSLGCNR